MKRRIGVLGVVLAVLLLMAGSGAGKAEATNCYTFYYDAGCSNYFDYTTWNYFYVAIHKDGTFDDIFGDWGYWEYFGSSMHLSYWDDSTGCYPAIAGTKKQGFYKCTDGDWWGADWPGCWYMKKAKLFNCGYYSPFEAEEEGESDSMESGPKNMGR
jgi:hypothetical protein